MKTLYQPGDILEEGQYLLKVIPGTNHWTKRNTGFFGKFTKTNTIPKAFVNWNYYDYVTRITIDPDIYIFDEYFREGWKIIDWRFGASQNWATLLHPEGFTLDIYLNNLLEICKENTIINSVIQGKFKWQDHKLIKEP
jgi:hypothetical protein